MKPKLIRRILDIHAKANEVGKKLTIDEKFIRYLADHCQELEKKIKEQDLRLQRMWKLETLGQALQDVIKELTKDVNA